MCIQSISNQVLRSFSSVNYVFDLKDTVLLRCLAIFLKQVSKVHSKQEDCNDGCYHFDLPLDVKKGIIRLVKYDLPIFQWVQ